jgi:hypothetical protein
MSTTMSNGRVQDSRAIRRPRQPSPAMSVFVIEVMHSLDRQLSIRHDKLETEPNRTIHIECLRRSPRTSPHPHLVAYSCLAQVPRTRQIPIHNTQALYGVRDRQLVESFMPSLGMTVCTR